MLRAAISFAFTIPFPLRSRLSPDATLVFDWHLPSWQSVEIYPPPFLVKLLMFYLLNVNSNVSTCSINNIKGITSDGKCHCISEI